MIFLPSTFKYIYHLVEQIIERKIMLHTLRGSKMTFNLQNIVI